ncbi:MAG TPA: hypothetical protein VF648_12615 [Pyrinomonadaceae bacterium]|jgi:hypothetical protein
MSCALSFPLTPFHCFFQRRSPKEIVEQIAELEEESKFSRIRCPLCQWQPTKASRWCCADCGFPEFYFGGCYTFWNTFETGGACPGCDHLWRWTSCLRCGGWSLHADWYESEMDKS